MIGRSLTLIGVLAVLFVVASAQLDAHPLDITAIHTDEAPVFLGASKWGNIYGFCITNLEELVSDATIQAKFTLLGSYTTFYLRAISTSPLDLADSPSLPDGSSFLNPNSDDSSYSEGSEGDSSSDPYGTKNVLTVLLYSADTNLVGDTLLDTTRRSFVGMVITDATGGLAGVELDFSASQLEIESYDENSKICQILGQVGCDGVLDSGLLIDECGVCGGDGSECIYSGGGSFEAATTTGDYYYQPPIGGEDDDDDGHHHGDHHHGDGSSDDDDHHHGNHHHGRHGSKRTVVRGALVIAVIATVVMVAMMCAFACCCCCCARRRSQQRKREADVASATKEEEQGLLAADGSVDEMSTSATASPAPVMYPFYAPVPEGAPGAMQPNWVFMTADGAGAAMAANGAADGLYPQFTAAFMPMYTGAAGATAMYTPYGGYPFPVAMTAPAAPQVQQ